MRKQLRCQIKRRAGTQLESMDDTLLSLLSRQIGSLDKRIEKLLVRNPTLQSRAVVLRSIPGFGPILTANLIGQMPELGALGEKQVAALVGVAPINRDSGKYAGQRVIPPFLIGSVFRPTWPFPVSRWDYLSSFQANLRAFNPCIFAYQRDKISQLTLA